jgi:RNA polymerase sigma-70 factor (ECF subfamily)
MRCVSRAARAPYRNLIELDAGCGEDKEVTSVSDAEVISASQPDPEAFGVLFDRHATVLFRYLVRRVGRDEAETLLGEVFRVAFEKRATYDTSYANARPWLYGIATNLLARHRRREARRIGAMARLAVQQPRALDVSVRVDEVVDAHELWPRVADAIAQLPDDERDALILYVWEELSYEEIATALGTPIGTVRSRLNRARQTLRELRATSGREA